MVGIVGIVGIAGMPMPKAVGANSRANITVNKNGIFFAEFLI
jgi:hypothetical protein